MKTKQTQTRLTPAALVALLSGQSDNFIAATTPGGIEAQEKAGQIEQSFLETLPVEGTSKEEERKQFELLGFKFRLNRVEAQNQGRGEIFVECKFPKGWRKKPTEHNMWSDLVDDKGRKRAGIFYKAAFYDRNAHVRLTNRYSYNYQPVGGYPEHYSSAKTAFEGVVTDCGKVIFTTVPTEVEPEYRGGNDDDKEARTVWLKWVVTRDILYTEAKKWLEDRFPDWQNPLAYWD